MQEILEGVGRRVAIWPNHHKFYAQGRGGGGAVLIPFCIVDVTTGEPFAHSQNLVFPYKRMDVEETVMSSSVKMIWRYEQSS